MDAILIAVYRQLVVRFGCSAEDILHDPELRAAFLNDSRQALAGEWTERDLLCRLSNLRKARKLPRSRDISAT